MIRMKEIVNPASLEKFRVVKIEWEGEVLVSDLEASGLRKLKENIIMPKERLVSIPDGEYHVGLKHTGMMNTQIKNIVVNFFEYTPGGGSVAHSHDDEQVFYVISGRSLWNIDGEECVVEPGSMVFLPSHTIHGYKALETVTMLCIMQKWITTGHIIYPKLSAPEIKSKITLDLEGLRYKEAETPK